MRDILSRVAQPATTTRTRCASRRPRCMRTSASSTAACPRRHRRRRLLVEITDVTRRIQISRENALLIQHGAGRQMIRQLAHEIKNPLGGIRGAAQLLERQLEEPELREYTDVVISETDRLAGSSIRCSARAARRTSSPSTCTNCSSTSCALSRRKTSDS